MSRCFPPCLRMAGGQISQKIRDFVVIIHKSRPIVKSRASGRCRRCVAPVCRSLSAGVYAQKMPIRRSDRWVDIAVLEGTPSVSAKRNTSRLAGVSFWRRHPDLNRGSRICSPMPYHLAMAPKNGAGNEIRTRYLHLGKVALCQMSYARKMVPPVGIEPTTRGFSVPCSTN